MPGNIYGFYERSLTVVFWVSSSESNWNSF